MFHQQCAFCSNSRKLREQYTLPKLLIIDKSLYLFVSFQNYKRLTKRSILI